MPDDVLPRTETIRTRADGGVLYATFDAPPLNLIGPELVRDLVALIGHLSGPTPYRAVVFDSADPDFFLPHVDLTKVPEYTAEAAKAGGPGDASLGMLYQRLSRLPVVTIGKLRGRARGGGSEFLLACDVRFAAGRPRSSASPRWASEPRPAPAASNAWPG